MSLQDPSILTLPLEVALLIGSHFHVLGVPQPLSYLESGPRRRPSDRHSLVALCATCRHLRDQFQRSLYRQVYPYHAQVEFAQTIAQRPDLAACVRELYYTSGAYESRANRCLFRNLNQHTFMVESASLTNFNELAAQQPGGLFWDDVYEDGEGSVDFPRLESENHDLRPIADDDEELKQCTLTVSLFFRTLQLLPNLRDLCIWWQPHHLDDMPPGILPRLQKFRLFVHDLDSQGISPLVTGWPLAAPELRYLECCFMEGVSVPEHPNVEELILTNCILTSFEFEAIGQSFGNLRKLAYAPAGAMSLAPVRDICQALLPVRHKLEELSIRLDILSMAGTNVEDRGPFLHSEPVLVGESDPTPLSQLTHLRRLTLDSDALQDLLSDGLGNERGYSYDQNILTGLLPSSLRQACFDLGHGEAYVIEALKRWASTCRQTCPDIETVALTTFQGSNANIAGLVEQLEAVGVTCLHSPEPPQRSSLLMSRHRFDFESPFASYDDWPGWAFWDHNADPMALASVYTPDEEPNSSWETPNT